MIQGKSGESQLGADVEVTEHVMSSRGGSIHGPQEKGNQESGSISSMTMLVTIVARESTSSEACTSNEAGGVG